MANRSGYDDDMLSKVIMYTEEALGKMNQVNNQISSLASRLPASNNSTSGVRLAQLLTDWNSEYNAIRVQLDGLNQKAIALRGLNRGVEEQTSTVPQ